jgi:mono/diheme cytochrome c family protein
MGGKEPMKKHMFPLIAICLLLGALSAAACGQQPAVEPTSIPTLAPATLPVATTAPEATTGGGPEDLVQAGSQVFEQNCSVCHNLTTETKVGPGLAGLFDFDQLPNGNPVNEENVKAWILSGGGAMPGVPLTEEQLNAVVAFLKDATQQ